MLTYQVARRDLENGCLAPVYLFHGEETFLQDDLLDLLAKIYLGAEASYGREKIDGSACTLAECLDRLEGGNIFTPRQLLIVSSPPYLAPPGKKKGAAGHKKDKTKHAGADPVARLAVFLERETARPVPEKIIAFTLDKADRRRRLFKLLNTKGKVVDCAPPRGEARANWIRQQAASLGKKIDQAAMEILLMDYTEDLWRLRREIEKFAAYLREDQDTITGAVVNLLYSGDPRGTVFLLADALSEGNLVLAFEQLQVLFKRREPPLLILFMIVRHYRLLLQARLLADSGIRQSGWGAALGVPPFVAGKLRRQISGYNRETLEDALLILHRVDLQIKTGRLEPLAALEFTLNRLHNLRRLHV